MRFCNLQAGVCSPFHSQRVLQRFHKSLRPCATTDPSNARPSVPSADRSSFMNHPAIAQREALRQFYLTFSSVEQLQVVQSSLQYLDIDTTLHMLCQTAELSLKGQLQGTLEEQDAVVRALYDAIASQIPELSSHNLGAVLWSIASVQSTSDAASSESSTWRADVVDLVAATACTAGKKVSSYNTKDVVNILFAVGAMCSSNPSPGVVDYAEQLMTELAQRMESTPYVKGSLSASDFADLVTVCARMFGKLPSESEKPVLPPAAELLMETVAGEVRRQLANRHSARSAFLPRDLTRFLTAYSYLGMRTPHVVAMFDVVGGYVVNRIRQKHLNCVSKPEDLAAVLAAYAAQKHVSVTVPELLTAVGEQLRRNAAQMQEQRAVLTSIEHVSIAPPDFLPDMQGGPPDLSCSIPTLLSLLDSHKCLGYSPDSLTLMALLPGLRRGLKISTEGPVETAQHAQQLLELFDVFQFNPGSATTDLLLAKVQEGADAVHAAE